MRRGASRDTDDRNDREEKSTQERVLWNGEHDNEETPEHGGHGSPQLLDSVLEPTAETGQALLRPPTWVGTGSKPDRRHTGPIDPDNTNPVGLPLYSHYDILAGLKVLAGAGLIHDVRCAKALDVLEGKRLADGGFPAEARHYKVSKQVVLGADMVNWGEQAP